MNYCALAEEAAKDSVWPGHFAQAVQKLRGCSFYSWEHKFRRWTHLQRVLKCLKGKLPAVGAEIDRQPREPGRFAQAIQQFQRRPFYSWEHKFRKLKVRRKELAGGLG